MNRTLSSSSLLFRLFAAAVTVVVFSCATSVSQEASGTQKASERVGIIIALGYGHQREARPTRSMAQRVWKAVELYREKKASKILFCGGYTSGHVAESEEMKIMAMALGVPSRSILVENGSISTQQNAANAKALIDKHRFRSAALVTHKNHMKRARKAFATIRRLARIEAHYADESEPPELDLRYEGDLPALDQFDAMILHAWTRLPDFPMDPMALGDEHAGLAWTAADLFQRGFRRPIYIWHRAFAAGHITRSEAIGIAAIALGVPQKWLLYSQSRRFSPEKEDLFDACKKNGWTRILAVIPPSRAKDSEEILAQYQEQGLEATLLVTGKRPGKKHR